MNKPPEADKGKKMRSFLESAEGAADADFTLANTDSGRQTIREYIYVV